ncbi:MAG: hypothetical protein A3I66_01040 [Burkholderiales bacterium RIFCSPLOWO2_02_FULL_57_36]|nr:MAG: hypothetical protein A3I66_01040 [Burkholderiales bacterium RIFCSPLOWO2_02_FULL_57_36]
MAFFTLVKRACRIQWDVSQGERKMKKILRLAILLASVNSYAGSADPGNLSNVHFMSDGVVLAYINK